VACALVLVAAVAALPADNAPAEVYTGESSGALDRVIQEQPDTEVLLAASASKDAPKEAKSSVALSFLHAIKSLASKTKQFFLGKEDASPQGEVMPPTIGLYYTPSQPISAGFAKVDDDTDAIVSDEAKPVPPVGTTQAAAQKQGATEAKKVEKIDSEAKTAPTATSPGTTGVVPPPPPAPSNSKPSKPTVAATASVKASPAKASAKVSTPKESSASTGCGVTFVTVGLAAMTVLVAM